MVIYIGEGGSMLYFTYCPRCGKIQSSINAVCVECHYSEGLAKSLYECKYYENKSLQKYGDYTHTFDFLNVEIRNNPLFNKSNSTRKNEYEESENNTNHLNDDGEWHRIHEDKNIPKCPICGSTNIQKISGTKKAASAILLGIFSTDIGKTFECKNCGMKF